jgi:hypothetical protein
MPRTRRRIHRLGEEVVFGQQLVAFERRHARLDHDVGFEVEHALDVAQRHVQDHAQARRQRLEEPDVRGRAGQLDVAHPLAAHLGQRHFHAALLADHAAVLQALVLAAQALVVLDRPEDLGAEQAVTLRFERAVVDGLRLLDLAERPRTDLLGRGQPDLDRVEMLFFLDLLKEIKQCFHRLCSNKIVVLPWRWARRAGWAAGRGVGPGFGTVPGARRRVRCGAPAGLAPLDSLRSLRSLRSNRSGENENGSARRAPSPAVRSSPPRKAPAPTPCPAAHPTRRANTIVARDEFRRTEASSEGGLTETAVL